MSNQSLAWLIVLLVSVLLNILGNFHSWRFGVSYVVLALVPSDCMRFSFHDLTTATEYKQCHDKARYHTPPIRSLYK